MSGSPSQISTTIALTQWEGGATAAERMCADVLRLEGFQVVDPQSPLGGPDGGKDILCERDGLTFVAASHFPHQPISFARSKKKFSDDLAGALKHGRNAFIFMTNQQLAPTERAALERLAASKGKRCRIMHREHLRVILDSPQGYAVRFRHLRIGMTPEEQAAYFAASGQSTATALTEQTRAIHRLAQRIDRLAREQNQFMLETVAVVAGAFRGDRSGEDLEKMLQASAEILHSANAESEADAVSARLSPALLRYIHRLLMPRDLPMAGRFRETQVWLSNPTGRLNADIEFVPWDRVADELAALCSRWNQEYPEVVRGDADTKIAAMAGFFNDLLAIHPFLDGNGRLARAILAQHARDLLRVSEDIRLERGPPYYAAVMEARAGDPTRLRDLIEAAADDAV